MRYVNLRGFITGKKTAVHNEWPLPWAHKGEVAGSKRIPAMMAWREPRGKSGSSLDRGPELAVQAIGPVAERAGA